MALLELECAVNAEAMIGSSWVTSFWVPVIRPTTRASWRFEVRNMAMEPKLQ